MNTQLFIKSTSKGYWVMKKWWFIQWKISNAGPFGLTLPWQSKDFAEEKIVLLRGE